MIKICIVGGTGALGRNFIEKLNDESNILLTKVITHSKNAFFNLPLNSMVKYKKSNLIISDDILKDDDEFDIIVDCSNAEALNKNLKKYMFLKKPLLIATTGMSIETISELERLSKDVPVCICSNFSVESAYFFDILECAINTIKYPNDIYIVETHGKRKKDMPSGTAKDIVNLFAKSVISNKIDVPIHSVRAGNLTGKHVVSFVDCYNGQIDISYTSGSRDEYSFGMILALKYLSKAGAGMIGFREIVRLAC